MGRIDDVFDRVSRKDFLPAAVAGYWNTDRPLPIGYDQTNSSPIVVKMMLGWLDVKRGDKVLDVGSGSGWTTALLGQIVGTKGRVYAVERISKLVKFGRENCKAAGVKNVEFHEAGKVFGLPKKAPFDRILVSASAHEVPKELVEQLKVGGKMVIPVGYDILEIVKKTQKDLVTSIHNGFIFVPLVGS